MSLSAGVGAAHPLARSMLVVQLFYHTYCECCLPYDYSVTVLLVVVRSSLRVLDPSVVCIVMSHAHVLGFEYPHGT